MVEEFDVGVKRIFNTLHGVVALILWPIAGYFVVGNFFPKGWGLAVGIIIGLVRFFVIRDKYSWQIATLNELKSVGNLVKSLRSGASHNTVALDEADKSAVYNRKNNVLGKVLGSKWLYFAGAAAMFLVLPFMTFRNVVGHNGFLFKYMFKYIFCFFKVALPLICSIAMVVLFFIKSSNARLVKIFKIAKIVLPFLALLSFVIIAPLTIWIAYLDVEFDRMFPVICPVVGRMSQLIKYYRYNINIYDIFFILTNLLFYAGSAFAIVSWFKTRKNEA